jgi:hypothetical protein
MHKFCLSRKLHMLRQRAGFLISSYTARAQQAGFLISSYTARAASCDPRAPEDHTACLLCDLIRLDRGL